MKKIIASIIMAGLAVFAASAQIRIATPNTEMIVDGELGGDLCFMYYGNILSDTDMESLSSAGVPWNDVYPVYGIWTDGERALEVTHSDGNLSTCLKMAGLDPDKKYVVHELNRVDDDELDYEGKTFTGKFLMEYGLEMPFKHWVDSELHRSDWTSRVLHLTECK